MLSALLLGTVLTWGHAPSETLTQLRAAIAAAAVDGLADAELDDLAARWEQLARAARDPGERTSVAQAGAALCRIGPLGRGASLRARVLAELCAAGATSGRARRVLIEACLPPLERLEEPARASAVRAFDAQLAELAAGEPPREVLAALTYAHLHLRLEAFRTWDCPWLDDLGRERMRGALLDLEQRFGDLAHPFGGSYGEVARRDAEELEQAAFGRVATDLLAGPDLYGNEVVPGELAGRVVLVVCWSSWCLPCLEAVPEERELVAAFAGAPFTLLGLCADDSPEAARSAAERTGMTWRSVLDGAPGGAGGERARRLGVRSWPSAFVLDRGGRLRHKFLATAFRPRWSTSDLRLAVASLLREEAR